jgi:hypothetical protein
MNKYVVILTVVVTLSTSIAQAKLVSFSSDAVYTWSESGVVISQHIDSPALSDIMMSVIANSEIAFTATTLNETDFIWTGYVLELEYGGAPTFVFDSARSTHFKSALYPNDWKIVFKAPDAVPIGEVVTLQFKMAFVDDAPYTFTLTQYPVPEPATFALLGLGTAVLLAQRKR